MIVEITLTDRGQFAQLAARFRQHRNGAAIRKALTTVIQAELKTIVVDVQDAARTMHIHATGGAGFRKRRTLGRGSRSRERFDVAAEMRRQSKAMAKGRTVRARRSTNPTGLRARVAHAVKSKVQYTGFRLGAKVYVEISNFPASQRKLPRYLNRAGGWRHPVWGHRDRWVSQFGEPYFDKPVEKHRPRVTKVVAAAVNQTLRSLQQ